ncbi:choice-of-anchor L domain-containing protein [Taibaiella soli]|nr:choice-of-anchor L domain-containing protein [Taibaiella soli]
MRQSAKLIFSAVALFITSLAHGQVNVYPSQTALNLAQTLTGQGVTISNAVLTCPLTAEGRFGIVSSNLGLDSGIILTNGTAQTNGTVIGVNGASTLFASTSFSGTIPYAPGDATLDSILPSGQSTNDGCSLEFDFNPAGDTVKFDYVFGSDEYPGFACSSFNDVFGFFISGPGIVGRKNLALVPGTTIPVSINSINNVTNPNSYCTSMGAGSPFTQYYVNNAAGTTITYGGFTTVLQAISAVTPCTTYHLKLAIADVGDAFYDSGVFLKAGSLTSNAVNVKPIGGGGLAAPTPYCVRGCSPGQFLFTRPVAKPTPLVIHYQIAGSAVNGVDYTTIPDSVVIPANGTVATRQIFGLPANPPTGPVIVKLLILSPYTCGTTGTAPIIDSAYLTIYDSLQAHIVTPDTAICLYDTVHLQAIGDTLLSYNWTPSTGLSDPNIRNPLASPPSTTTYTLNASLAGSGCAVVHRSVTVTIKQPPIVDAGPDRVTCLGTPVQFNVTTTPANQTYTYSWTPGTSLNSTSVPDPVFTPVASQVGTGLTYYIVANPGAAGCNGYDTVSVRVLPNDFTLYTPDTAICQGMTVNIQADGDPAFSYLWTPANGVSDTTVLMPSITPDSTHTYSVTASYPSCPNITKSITIDVQPNPIVYVGPDRTICQWDTLQLNPSVTPGWYTHYIYNWTPGTHIDEPTQKDIIFSGEQDTTLTLTVTTPAGCKGSDDMNIVVHPGNFAAMTPADTAICPRDTVAMHATGGVAYSWTPALGLNDAASADPVAYPTADIDYTGIVTDQYGCKDTVNLNIVVHPNGVVEMEDSVAIYPGESYQMNPRGNCTYFEWFPPLGLTATNISNPIAMPSVNTKYIVKAKTEFGCAVTDSISVYMAETVLGIPNAFSPGSAPNDILKINKRGIVSLKYFRIFNRWGTKVFETSDIEQGWDGALNGTPQPMGVYVYMIEAYTDSGRRFYKQGNVTLIR